ncbi:hypothetical protein MOMA_07211 [Moraxella macacae 0408225]|uniref:Uncharacterized protein n=1 Tax=Moraxella macacae 0408225 TaxID=1230338 RepID=L2F5M3_9GAMM|nr:hypothetical protein MOMA_07211 [Moraxella macacae 0408225]
MNASNNPQDQKNKQKQSWIQDWIDAAITNSNRMATDENYRQEVSKRATPSKEEVQATLARNLKTTSLG